MAEFLIYDRDNWMDVPSKDRPALTGHENVRQKIMNDSSLSLEQSTMALGFHEMKYTARHQRGDIVEARRDGGPRGKLEEASFAFLQVLSVSLEEARGYCEPKLDLLSLNETLPVVYRRGHYIDRTGLVFDSHRNVSLTESEFRSRLKVKK